MARLNAKISGLPTHATASVGMPAQEYAILTHLNSQAGNSKILFSLQGVSLSSRP